MFVMLITTAELPQAWPAWSQGACKDAQPIVFGASGSCLGRCAPDQKQWVANASRGVTQL